MPLRWPDEPGWQALAAPLQTVLEPALARLDLKPTALPRIVAADPAQPRLGDDGTLGLDPALLGPGTRHPDDQDWAEAHPELGGLALDRWRRAAGLVLEGIALAGLRERIGAPLPDAWWTIGPAAQAVACAAPELGWLWPEAADLLNSPQDGLAAAPRRAAWLVHWFAHTGRSWPLGERPALDATAWRDFGAWLLDPAHGPAAAAPLPIMPGPLPLAPSPQALDRLPPLSHCRVHLEAGPAGIQLDWSDGSLVLPGEHATDRLFGSVHGGPLDIVQQPLLPLGRWILTGGTAGERPGAARGIELDFRANGHIDMVFADAFAGPPTPYLLDLGRQIGVSGTGTGRFTVTEATGPGQGSVVFDALDPGLLSVHPRFSGRFALPAETVLGPVHRTLKAMVGVPWTFVATGEELRLSASIMGMSTVLRLTRPAPEAR